MDRGQDQRGAEKVEGWLRAFMEKADGGPFGVPYSHHFPGEATTDGAPHVGICVLTHGNEFGTLPAALRLQEELAEGRLKLTFPVTLLLGNPEAARKNVRFVEEDFNRVMTFDRPADNRERRRADEVRPLLDAFDFFLDIHQTQTETARAFWTMPWEGQLGLWARALGGAGAGLTRKAGGVFSKGKCCLDEYVRARGKVGITVEVGERGVDAIQADLAYDVMLRALEVNKSLLAGESLQALAEQRPAIEWFATKDVVPAASSAHRLRPGICNFTEVKGGELLSPPGSPEIRASENGQILFPKFPGEGEPPPPELFRLAVRVNDPEAEFG